MSEVGPNALGEVPWLPSRGRVAALLVFSLALSIWAAFAGRTPPSVVPASAPASAFSAARVRATLERIYEGMGAHPIGSDANAEVRRRIERELRAMGLQPEHRRHTVCGSHSCGWADNIVVRIEGEVPGPAVLLACHYDSVPAAPGVADDGSGVGIALEVARALSSGPPPRSPVLVLFDDGEEAGLFGARAFVEQDARAADVAVVVNVEARGTSGVSTMFETKGPSRWMLDPYLQRADHPRVSSLGTTVYERMPNDTDLTVFGEAGLPGLNFAFVAGGGRYHTPRDDLDHLSWDSVQHQGGEAFAAVSALASLDLTAPPPADEDVYETLCGWVVRWPRPWSLGLALAALVVTLVVVGAGARTGRLRVGRVALAWVGLLVAFVVTVATLWVVSASTDGLTPMPVRFSSRAPTLRLGWWTTVVAATPCSGWVLARIVRGCEALAAFCLGAAALAVGVVAVVPGACGMPVTVAGLSSVGLLIAVFGPSAMLRAAGLALIVIPTVAIGMELSLALQDLFGSGMPLIPAGALALAALAMIPGVVATARDRVPLFVGLGLLWCGTLVTALGAATLDYDRDNPYPVDLALVRDASQGQARWWTMSFNGPPPPSMVQAGFGPQTQPLLYGYPAFPGPGSALGLGPGLEITDVQRRKSGGGTIRGRLRSARGSTVGWLLMTPPEVVRGVRLDGQPVSGLRVRSGDGEALSIRLHGLPSEGTPMEIDVTSAERLHVRAADVHFGLPAGEETARWTAIRPQWAAPLQFGDVDLVFTEFDL